MSSGVVENMVPILKPLQQYVRIMTEPIWPMVYNTANILDNVHVCAELRSHSCKTLLCTFAF